MKPQHSPSKGFWLILSGLGLLLYACQPTQNEVNDEAIDSVGISSDPTVMPAPDSIATRAKQPTSAISAIEQSLLDAGLVNVQSLDSSIRVEMKYSTTDNFVGVDVYGDFDKAYLQEVAAQKLAKAQQYLSEKQPGYHLLVYDAARPRRVQQILWDTLQKPVKLKPLYVADPKEGSIHNYGAAVDLTIADSTGKPLDMGTHYDYFGLLAYPSQEDSLMRAGKLTEEHLRNRKLLREVMRRAGFTPIESEWWHFNALSLARCKREYPIIE